MMSVMSSRYHFAEKGDHAARIGRQRRQGEARAGEGFHQQQGNQRHQRSEQQRMRVAAMNLQVFQVVVEEVERVHVRRVGGQHDH
jgi:hypothetical protein